ncbi:MAG: LicD family protein [Clostridia bacterium]|nr:LicD family protein [Clostridia bacterium]
MSNLTTREIQLSCLEVLKEFDALCKANRLTYFLSGGTLLGAIRHKGFIPWDDDVDVMMPRADYERLLSLKNPRVYSVEGGNYGRPWARMADEGTRRSSEALFTEDTSGTYIDIFPIDGVPEGKLAAKLFYRRIRLYDMLWRTAMRNSIGEKERMRALKKIAAALLRPIGPRPFARRMNKIAMAQDYGGKYRGVSMITHYDAREKMPAGVFDHAVEVDFEGLRLPAPCGYDAYLTRLYGDYMVLPPEHRRATHNASYQKSEANE